MVKLISVFFFIFPAHSYTQNWNLAFGGDVMLSKISYKSLVFKEIIPFFCSADFSYVNLEIPLTTSSKKTSKKTLQEVLERSQYILSAHPRHAKNIKELNISVVGLANNHIMDYGYLGLKQTQLLMNHQDVLTCGAGYNQDEAERLAISVKKDKPKIGFLSFLAFVSNFGLSKCTPATSNAPGVAVLNFEGNIDSINRNKIKAFVQKAKQYCDILVVALHWGIEKQIVPTPYQVQLARTWIDEGADIILGSHPHVLQGAELYKNKPIFYSLGNLISTQPGITAVFKVFFKNNHYLDFEIFPCVISNHKITKANLITSSRIKTQFKKLSEKIQDKYFHSHSKMIIKSY